MKSLIVVLCCLAYVRAVVVQRTWNGVLDKRGNYIPGSILVWAENSNRAKIWADNNGIAILIQAHDVVVNYDKAMIAKQTADALGLFYVNAALSGLLPPYISNCKCRQWFADTHTIFTPLVRGMALGTVSMQQANAHLIERYHSFERACGMICNYSPTPVDSEIC